MKKFLRITAALAAVFAMVNFVACKDDDDDGDDGNGFENTYWVLEDIVDEDDGYTLTSSAVGYVHIKDGTTGTIYETSDDMLEQADTELITGGVTASKEVAYDKTSNFTYTIEGSAIKITYKDETGKDVSLNVTVAEDKNSFSYTEGEGEDAYTLTYKKAPEAPKAAKVTYTVKTAAPADPETPTEPAPKYSFTADMTKLGTTIEGIVAATEDSSGKAKLTVSEETVFDGSAVLYSRSEGKLIRRKAGETYSINYGNSSLAKAGASGNGQFTAEEAAVGSTIDFGQKIGEAQNRDGYVGVDLTKVETLTADKDVKITFSFYTVANKDCSDDCGVVAVVDANGRVLASKTGLKLKTGAGSGDVETVEVTVKGQTQAYLLFSRNGCTKSGKGSGGIDVTGITVAEL